METCFPFVCLFVCLFVLTDTIKKHHVSKSPEEEYFQARISDTFQSLFDSAYRFIQEFSYTL